MTQQTGQEESQTIDARLKKIDEILETYEGKLGLGRIGPPSEIDKYLNLDRQGLAKLTAEECGDAAYILTRFAHYIQRELNKETSRITWANDLLPIMIANEVGKYKGYSYEERKYQAIKNNSAALKLHQIKSYAQQRRDRLEYQAMYVENTARRLDSLQQTKRRDRNG